MNRYYRDSAIIHLVFLGALIGPSIFRPSPPILWLDTDMMMPGPGGGGGGGGGQGGPKPKDLGQVVPNPEKVPIPAKPAAVQPETVEKEKWNIKDPVKDQPDKTPKEASPDAEVDETAKPAQSNVIRRGQGETETEGDGNYDFGPGEGTGPGVGIGIGPGSGGGFGYGSYLRLLRQRIWQEWTQSAVYGTNLSCVVALTVNRAGQVSQVKLEKTSGMASYDNVALRAVRNSNPLPPLPANFPESEQRFRIQFKLQE